MLKLITSTVLGLFVAGFFITNAWGFPEDPPGKVIFKDSKCGTCHSITAQGIAKAGEEKKEKAAPDLSDVGTKHKADWISKYLLKKETLNDDKHLKKFKGTDEELETLSNWLATLKK